MNTDTISTGIIAVDYSKSLQNMMADGSYDWVNPAITPKGFPITAVGIVQFETKVFHFNRYISSEDAVEAITADDRRNFWEPAKIEGLLAYGVKNPNEQRQYPIVGLGSFAEVLGSRYVPYLCGRGAGRGLDLLEGRRLVRSLPFLGPSLTVLAPLKLLTTAPGPLETLVLLPGARPCMRRFCFICVFEFATL